MRKTISLSVIPICIVVLFASCKKNIVTGHGAVGDEQRDVPAFTGIEISMPIETSIRVDSAGSSSITLSGYKNILEYVQTEVKGGVLHISAKERVKIKSDKDLNMVVSLPALNYFKISGTSDAHIHGNAKADKMTIGIKGAGDVEVDNVHARNLEVTLTGVGDLRLNGGVVEYANYKVSGAGEINAKKVSCNNVKASVSGIGDISVNAVNTLDARISGAGNISYIGHPSITQHISGVGEIENVNHD